MSPCTSIILPVFNRAAYLPQAVESVMAQTHTAWKLMIVDDASTDNSLQIARSYAALDDRIQVFRLKENTGNPARPRNVAMSITDSRYIAFLDSDDIWHPQKLARQINYMNAREAAFTFTAFHIMNKDGEITQLFDHFPTRLTHLDFIKNTCMAPSTVMVDRDKMPTPYFVEGYKTGEDFRTFYELLKTTPAHGIKQPLVFYRRSPDALSRNAVRSAWNQAKTYAAISKDVGILPVIEAYAGYASRALMKRLHRPATVPQRETVAQKITRPAPW